MATDFQFRAGPHDEGEWVVLRFTGTEGISQPYRFDITIGAQDLEVDFEEVIGSDACLTFSTPEGERYVHGVVSRWEESGRSKHWTQFEASIVPRLWTLGLNRQSRIFQSQTTADIIKAVLTEAGVASDQFRFSLQGSYKPRLYCVQYRETDLEFVTRLLEEEGMFYFFEQTEDGHVAVFADANDACVPIPGNDTLAYREGDLGMLGLEQIVSLRYNRSLRIGSVSLREYDFKKPSLRLEATQEDTEQTKESLFTAEDYPGEYPDQGLGDRLVKVRLEEQRAERYLGVGESDCRRLTPGWRFTLEDHPHDPLNQEYLVVSVRHRGTQPQGGLGAAPGGKVRIYRNHLEIIPAAIPFRPARVTPRPHIDGVQTAMVVGPAGEEIHCDEFGRVKVRFPWDRSGVTDDKASCWIRVSQQWGGEGWGAMTIPRIGHEVVVDFLEGDPDRPLITGRVYNGGNPVPYELPQKKIVGSFQSQTSPGGGSANEVRLTDTASGQEVFVNASKDMNGVTANNQTEKIKVNEIALVGANVQRTVEADEKVTIVHNRTETVTGDQMTTVKGDDTVNVDGSRDRTIGSVRMGLVKGDWKTDVGGSDGRSIGAITIELVKGESKREIDGGATTTVGAISLHAVKGEHSEEVEGDFTRTTGGAILRKFKEDIEQESEGMVIYAAPLLKINAEDVEFEADDGIHLVVGGSSISIASGSVSVTSGKVEVKSSGSLTEKGSMIPWN